MGFLKDTDEPEDLVLVLMSEQELKKAEKKIIIKIDDEADDIVFVDAEKNQL